MATIEALWTVRFGQMGTPEASLEGGVAVMESGRIFGGDSGYAYLGSYDLSGSTISGDLHIIRHGDPKHWQSVYGLQEAEFKAGFEGTRKGDDLIVGALKRPGFPDGQLVLRRLAELP